jgi:hypothetical protein
MTEESFAVRGRPTPVDDKPVLVVTMDGYVIYDPRDGYTIGQGETDGHLRRIVAGELHLVPVEGAAG